MTNTLKDYKFVIGIPLIIISGMIAFTMTQFFLSHQKIFSNALTIDLVFAIPIIHFLLIRKKRISKFSVITLMVLCIALASLIIPKNHQELLTIIKLVIIPASEIFLIIAVLIGALRFKKNFEEGNYSPKDFYGRIKATCRVTFPNRFGEILSTEIGILYYFLTSSKAVEYKKNEFTYFRKNGIKELVGAFVFILIIETAVAHILINMWNPFIANLCSLSSIYLVVLLISIYKSTKSNPITINEREKSIDLKYGFLNHTIIKISDIQSIEKSRKNNDSLMKLSAFKDFDGHNVIINLSNQATMNKLYGIQKKFESIGIYVDEPEKFIEQIESVRKGDWKQNI